MNGIAVAAEGRLGLSGCGSAGVIRVLPLPAGRLAGDTNGSGDAGAPDAWPGTSVVTDGTPYPIIRLRRGNRRTADAVILAELRRVAGLVPPDGPTGGPLTTGRYWRHGRVSYTLVQRRFGSWQAGLDAAGLGHRYGGRVITAKQRARPARRLSDGALLAEMRRLAKEIGRPTLRVEDLGRSPVLTYSILKARFGCWDDAVRRAGLTRAVFGRRYSGTQVYENLICVWRHLERPPTKSDMARYPSRIGVMPYLTRFGTWAETLEAFARRAAIAPDDHAGRRAARLAWERPVLRGEAVRFPEAGTRPYAMPAPARLVDLNAIARLAQVGPKRVDLGHLGLPRIRTAKTAAAVSQKLRFAVLARDRYRCQACGNSPALDSACTLEIDHVQPVSKGGATEPANLRVLCGACNRGKGNRQEQEPAETASRCGEAGRRSAAGA